MHMVLLVWAEWIIKSTIPVWEKINRSRFALVRRDFLKKLLTIQMRNYEKFSRSFENNS